MTGRLDAVDGLRAFAAMWVVLFHMRAFSQVQLPGPLDLFVRSGSTGVSLFLVISGFCLFLPVAGGRTDRFRTLDFLARRARRLLPAYYGSLAALLALDLALGARYGFTSLTPGAGLWQLVTHTAMLHPFFDSTFYTVNGAYWSLGLEWQLYLALPLLVIGARRFGLARTAGAAIAVNVIYRVVLSQAASHGMVGAGSVAATVILPNLLPGRWAEFVLGMIAADLYATGRLTRWSERLGARLLGFVPVIIGLVAISLLAVGNPLSHLLFGSVFFLLLCLVLTTRSPLHGLFSWPPIVAVGIMSYSLYLVHQPLVQAIAFIARTQAGLPAGATFVLLVALLPVILAVAWLLFTTIERRTLSSRRWNAPGTPGALLMPATWFRRTREEELPPPLAARVGVGGTR